MGVVWTFFSHLSFLFSFSLSLGDGPIWTKILSQRAVKPKTTNLYGELLFTWLSLVMSLKVSFYADFFPRDVLDEIWD